MLGVVEGEEDEGSERIDGGLSSRVFITPTPWARAVRAVGREGSG